VIFILFLLSLVVCVIATRWSYTNAGQACPQMTAEPEFPILIHQSPRYAPVPAVGLAQLRRSIMVGGS
jgi:hypothetical protein